MIPHVLHIHLAFHHAQSAAVAPVRIHFHPGQGETVEKAVNRAQRANKAAEGAVTEHAGQADHQHDHPFVGKHRPQLIEGGGVHRVLQQADRAFKGSRRADVFAEAGQDDPLPDAVDQRNGDHKHREEHIFQIGQFPRNMTFPDLRCRNLVQQLLNQTQGADPSADGSPQNHAEQRQDAQHIPGQRMPGSVQRVLQRAQRAAGNGARAGIAVEARNAD